MIRNDTYALYQGKEYRIVTGDEKGKYELISYNNMDLLKGFFADDLHDNMFIKKISLDEVETVYSLNTYCIYKGVKYDVVMEDEDNNQILMGDYSVMHQNLAQLSEFGFEMVERGVYHKWVTKDEVERIFEVKETEQWFLEETNRSEN